MALGLFAVLAVLAWTTISDQKFKLATVAVLAMFAVRTWSWSRKQEREERDRHDEIEAVSDRGCRGCDGEAVQFERVAERDAASESSPAGAERS